MSQKSQDSTLQYTVEDLVALMEMLRNPDNGCPWDVKQTYKSILPSTVEEAYEVADAIEQEDFRQLREELGDLLFQVIFYSQMAAEDGHFSFPEVVSGLVSKLIRRHPHVFPGGTLDSFGDAPVDLPQSGVLSQWEQLKKDEREAKGFTGLLDDIPANMPSMTRAVKLQKRAGTVGFDWPSIENVLAKIKEELEEVEDALKAGDTENLHEELGDLLFAVVNACRHTKADPETVLRATNRKFSNRFAYIESTLKSAGKTLEEVDLEAMDHLWDEAKTKLK